MAKFNKTRECLRQAKLVAVLAAVSLTGGPYGIAQSQSAQGGTRPAQSNAEESTQFQTLSKRAMDALDVDKVKESIPLFRKALALNPKWTEGWWSLGTAYYDQDSYAEAELAFQRVVALDPGHGTAHALLGLCEFELGDDKAALHNIEASKDLGTNIDPQLRDVVFYHEGVLLQRAGRFVAAEKPFASLCEENGGGGDVARGFGMAALRMRDRQFPATGSEAAIVAEQVGRAACTAAQKNYDSARDQFNTILKAYPHFPYVHYVFGRVLIDAQDLPGAIAEFKREIDEGHDRVLPMLQIAAADYKVDPAAGLTYAQQAVALAPQLPFAHYLLGLLLVNNGEEAKAIPELEMARKAFPEDTRIYWSLGTAYARVGRTQDAAKARAEIARIYKKTAPQEEGAIPSEPKDTPISVTDAAGQGPKN